jgi:hypothetical protein
MLPRNLKQASNQANRQMDDNIGSGDDDDNRKQV